MPGCRFLAATFLTLALAVAVGCSSGSKGEQASNAATASPAPTRTPAATATPAATSTPSATTTTGPTSTPTVAVPSVEPLPASPTDSPAGGEPTPVPASQVQLTPTEIGQGQSATLTLPGYNASSATAICDGRRYPLVLQDGSYWGVIAAAGDAQPGIHAITVELSNANGDVMADLATQVTVVDMGYPVENIDLPPDVDASLDPALVQQEDDARTAVFSQFTAQKLWLGQFIWPVQPVVVSSPYGIRRSYNGGPVSSFHGGIDLAVDEGVPVVAANSGRVAWVGTGPDYGNTVLIDHGDGVFSGYSHLSAVAVQAGQMVNKGDLVGNVGSTGMATGPHLHWEIDIRGVPVDPMPLTLQTMGP